MRDVFTKALKLIVGVDSEVPLFKITKRRPFRELTTRELIQLESQIGAKIFGPVPKNGRREFFNEDSHNWIWYEEWVGPDGKSRSMTTRYEIHKDKGVLKVRQGEPYVFIEGQELQNLSAAIQMYHEQVMRDVYKRDHRTGKRLI